MMTKVIIIVITNRTRTEITIAMFFPSLSSTVLDALASTTIGSVSKAANIGAFFVN